MTSLAVHLGIVLPIFLMSIVCHEVSHGWVAHHFGDPTAQLRGRLSLNPLRHLDPIGTILLPLLLIFTHAPFIFGWAKPVPIDIQQLDHPKQDLIWVGLAGPVANLALAVVIAAGLRLTAVPPTSLVGVVGTTAIVMNLVLGLFNLLPVPPLDGSRVAVGLLPWPLARCIIALEPIGLFLIFGLLWLGVLQQIVGPAVTVAARWLGVALP